MVRRRHGLALGPEQPLEPALAQRVVGRRRAPARRRRARARARAARSPSPPRSARPRRSIAGELRLELLAGRQQPAPVVVEARRSRRCGARRARPGRGSRAGRRASPARCGAAAPRRASRCGPRGSRSRARPPGPRARPRRSPTRRSCAAGRAARARLGGARPRPRGGLELRRREEVAVALDDRGLLGGLLLPHAHRAALLGALEEVAREALLELGRRPNRLAGYRSGLVRDCGRRAPRARTACRAPRRPARAPPARSRSCPRASPRAPAGRAPRCRRAGRARSSAPTWTSRRTTSIRLGREQLARRPRAVPASTTRWPSSSRLTRQRRRSDGSSSTTRTVCRPRSSTRVSTQAGAIVRRPACDWVDSRSVRPIAGSEQRHGTRARARSAPARARADAARPRLGGRRPGRARRADADELPHLQYALHAVGEQALVPLLGRPRQACPRSAHEELEFALAVAREETADVAEMLVGGRPGRRGSAPLGVAWSPLRRPPGVAPARARRRERARRSSARVAAPPVRCSSSAGVLARARRRARRASGRCGSRVSRSSPRARRSPHRP